MNKYFKYAGYYRDYTNLGPAEAEYRAKRKAKIIGGIGGAIIGGHIGRRTSKFPFQTIPGILGGAVLGGIAGNLSAGTLSTQLSRYRHKSIKEKNIKPQLVSSYKDIKNIMDKRKIEEHYSA